MNKFITFAPCHQASAVCGGRFRTSYVIPTKEDNYSFSKIGLPTNVIPTKESIYSLASLSYNVINNNRFLPFGRNDIVICFHYRTPSPCSGKGIRIWLAAMPIRLGKVGFGSR